MMTTGGRCLFFVRVRPSSKGWHDVVRANMAPGRAHAAPAISFLVLLGGSDRLLHFSSCHNLREIFGQSGARCTPPYPVVRLLPDARHPLRCGQADGEIITAGASVSGVIVSGRRTIRSSVWAAAGFRGHLLRFAWLGPRTP